MLSHYPGKNSCKCELLSELINGYMNQAIEIALIKIYEVVKFVQRVDSSFKYHELETDPIGLVMAYRNYLVTHFEKHRGSAKGEQYAGLFRGKSRRIYRDIENAISEIKYWLQLQDLGGRSSSTHRHSVFSEGTLSDLIAAASLDR